MPCSIPLLPFWPSNTVVYKIQTQIINCYNCVDEFIRILIFFYYSMKPARYAYVTLANQNRENKKEGNKRYKKSSHELYQKSRLTMAWRIQHFAKKQNFQSRYIGIGNLTQLHPTIRQQYKEFEEKLTKYWGGGKYFKKMSRMDKVRAKQNIKPQTFGRNQFTQLFHNLENKFTHWARSQLFYSIINCKKLRRNFQSNPQNQI